MIFGYRRARRASPAELNITAFMNLMVALVPFLLITAVFTQMAVHELTLPPPSSDSAPDTAPPKILAVVVRSSGFSISDGGDAVGVLPRRKDGHDLKGLSAVLAKLKKSNPAREEITLLMEPAAPYDLLIQVMDAARVNPADGQPMFPKIGIGDAPPTGGKS